MKGSQASRVAGQSGVVGQPTRSGVMLNAIRYRVQRNAAWQC